AEVVTQRLKASAHLLVTLPGADPGHQLIGLLTADDALQVVLENTVEAIHLLISGAGSNQPHDRRDAYSVVGTAGFLIGEAEQGEGRRWRMGLPLGLDGRQLDLLHIAQRVAGLVTQHYHR